MPETKDGGWVLDESGGFGDIPELVAELRSSYNSGGREPDVEKDMQAGDDAKGGFLVRTTSTFSVQEVTPQLLLGLQLEDLGVLRNRLRGLWAEIGDEETAATSEGALTREDVADAHAFLESEMKRRGHPLPKDDPISEAAMVLGGKRLAQAVKEFRESMEFEKKEYDEDCKWLYTNVGPVCVTRERLAGILGVPVDKIIRERDGRWCLLTRDGSRTLGCHDTKEEAEAQERAVQANKVLAASVSGQRPVDKAEDGRQAPGEEGGTRSAPARRFWRERWHESFPEGGRGQFVYHHHWRGLSEEATGSAEKALMETDHSVHGDLRLSVGDALIGFAVFLGSTADNRKAVGGDRFASLPPGGVLQGSFKLQQPKAWLGVGMNGPLVVEPGGAGAAAENWSKFFAHDHGEYDLGVMKQNFVEVFLNGGKLRGRYLMQNVLFGGPERTWTITKPEDQAPFAETHKLADEVADQLRKGRDWIVWAKPGEKPEKINVKTWEGGGADVGKVTATETQSIVTSKDKFKTLAEAKKWVADHEFKADDADETGTSWRFRQFPPGQCQEEHIRTIDLDDGVQAVICRPSEVKKQDDCAWVTIRGNPVCIGKAFCSTGEGGGVDPSCSSGGGRGEGRPPASTEGKINDLDRKSNVLEGAGSPEERILSWHEGASKILDQHRHLENVPLRYGPKTVGAAVRGITSLPKKPTSDDFEEKQRAIKLVMRALKDPRNWKGQVGEKRMAKARLVFSGDGLFIKAEWDEEKHPRDERGRFGGGGGGREEEDTEKPSREDEDRLDALADKLVEENLVENQGIIGMRALRDRLKSTVERYPKVLDRKVETPDGTMPVDQAMTEIGERFNDANRSRGRVRAEHLTVAAAMMAAVVYDGFQRRGTRGRKSIGKQMVGEGVTIYCPIVKASADAGFVLAPVLVPEVEDLQGDVISEEEIERACYDFMEEFQSVGIMHQKVVGNKDIVMVENYILRAPVKYGEVALPKGTWMAGFRIYNQKIRDAVKSGKLKGVSIGGTGTRTSVQR